MFETNLRWLLRKSTFIKLAAVLAVTATRNSVFGVLISGGEASSKTLTEPSVTDTQQTSVFLNKSGLSDHQRIKLKEIRKLARLAGHEQPEGITEVNNKTCYKDDCLDAAKEFYESMDFSQNPCENWKKFACEWRTLSSSSSLDQLTSLSLKAQDQLYDILTDYETESETIHLAQSYFESCVEWFSNDLTKRDGILSYIDSVGNWPLLSGKTNAGNTDWVKVLVEILKVLPDNVPSPLFKFDVSPSNGKMVLKLESGSSSFDFDYEDVSILLQFLRKATPVSGSNEMNMFEDMKKLMSNLSATSFRVKESESTSLQALQDQLKSAVPDSKIDYTDVASQVIHNTTHAVVTDVKGLTSYLKALESSDPVVLLNVLFLHLVLIVIGDSTLFLDELKLTGMGNYKRHLSRHPTQQCLKETSELFNYALSEEYIHRYFHEQNSDGVNKVISYLKDGFLSTIESMKWLESKDVLREKIKDMTFAVAYPTSVKNDTWIQMYYDGLKQVISGRVYVYDRLSMLSWLNGKFWTMKLRNDTSNIWNYNDENAFAGNSIVEYVPSLNQLRIPAGAIQSPAFAMDSPGFINFAGLGSVIAKEMAHVLDTRGIFLRKEGSRELWLDDKSYKSYIDWTNRLQRVWGNDEISLNDKITSLLSYHIVVRGYEKYLVDEKEKNELPGMSILSHKKLLHVKFTNLHCESKSVRRLRLDKEYTGYDRSSYDSIGLLPIMKASSFRKLFDCKAESTDVAFDLM